jgi:23S rRNA (cytidine2498-2'-O)-methyltransferase
MKRLSSEFVFALTNPGSEKALKLEVVMANPQWRLSYQRRGFVTFKSDCLIEMEGLDLPLAFARRLCLSLGKSATREDAVARIREVAGDSLKVHHARYHERRMQGLPAADPARHPEIGEWIGTVVELGDQEFWSGVHRHAPFLSPDPAGDSGIVMPDESPSRAWLKLEEAVRFFGLAFSSSDLVAEVGCAPGGVVLALLNRGVSVIGVDPARMADEVTAFGIGQREDAAVRSPWFYHCRKPAALVSKRDLGQGVTWFMSDMNQSPEVVLKECARFCKMSPSIRGVLITLKLTDLLQIGEKARWFLALEGMGFTTVRAQQLSVHHKEVALLGLR